MLPYSAPCISARSLFHLCVTVLVSTGLFGCSAEVESAPPIPDPAPHVADCVADADCSIPNAVASCVDERCQRTGCTIGYAACTLSYGCPIKLATDRHNCGACGVVCPGAYLGGACEGGAS